MRRAALLMMLTLCGCAAGNTGAKFQASHINLAPALTLPTPAAVMLPPSCPPELREPIPAEPQLPDDAYFPRPENPAAMAPTQRYFQWLSKHHDWDKQLVDRLQKAADYCNKT